MAELRATHGPDAIILNSECSSNGNITLRIAVEQGLPAPASTAPASVNAYAPDFSGDDASECVALIAGALEFHRIPEPIAAMLLHTVEALAVQDPIEALASALAVRYAFSPLPVLPARPILLIGPAGAGKTITAAKLAARARLAGQEPVLITTDLVRGGGVAQLEAYAGIMKVSLHRADGAEELAGLLEKQSAAHACIIDTTGTSPYNLAELKILRNLVMAAECDPVLVLPAGGDSAEACEIVNIFAGFGARGMIFTRLDATRRLGSIVGALESAAMTLHHVSITPYIANGLAPISAMSLSRILLEDPIEHASFKELEQAAQ